MEELKKQIDKSYEELMTEAKKRPEAEAEMFKRVTRKLDAGMKSIDQFLPSNCISTYLI